MKDKGGNVTSKKRQETAQRIIKAVKETKGLLTTAAPRAGISYRTILRYANEFSTVKKAVIEAKEEMKDYTENQLFNAIGEHNLTAIIFYLKTQAKDRGFTERSEVKAEVEHSGKLKYEEVPSELARRIGKELAEEEEKG